MRKIKRIISQVLLITMVAVVTNIASVETINETKDEYGQISVGETRKSYDNKMINLESKIAKEPVQDQKNQEVAEPEKDTDNDGLEDGLEELFGADPNKRDTDGDGIEDLIEVKASLAPDKEDTDSNGIDDAQEDTDGDGLTNAEEVVLGTNCTVKDTDNDGISDGDEVKIYSTSPVNADTDGDTIWDGDEVKLGLNPASQYTNGITKDSEWKIQQILSKDRISKVIEESNYEFVPSISGEISGLIDRKIFINAYDTTPIESIKELVGGAINIEYRNDNRESLKLSFDCSTYLKNKGISELKNLAICKHDNNNYTKLDTKINGTVLSADILEGGVYFVGYSEEVKKADNYMLEETYIQEFNYASISSNTDSDYDGIEDSKDSMPNNNKFSGTLKTGQATSKVSYTMDYRNFFASKKQYNSNIATISSLFSADIYGGSSFDGLSLDKFMAKHGIKDIKNYNLASLYSDSDVSEAKIGHRKVTYNGVTKEIIVIVVRGTNGTIQEWTSNFDIGSTSQKSKYPDWKIASNHKGFDIAATRILKCLKEYEEKSYLDKSAKKTYWVMGHSRGAGIANVIGARLVTDSKDVYTYTFASPGTTTASNAEDTNVYPGIYNIINKEDLIPRLPVAKWGFKHYGKSYRLSVADKYEKEWESLTGKTDYDPDTFGLDDTEKEIGKIMKNRNDAYVYTCKCHGDGSSDNISIKNCGTSKESREGAIAKIPSNALPYCKITRYDGKFIAGWDFKVCQQPEYFMQLLAAFMANKINAYRFAVELNIADRYVGAKFGIIKSGIGGLAHPHYNESYYLLSKHI